MTLYRRIGPQVRSPCEAAGCPNEGSWHGTPFVRDPEPNDGGDGA